MEAELDDKSDFMLQLGVTNPTRSSPLLLDRHFFEKLVQACFSMLILPNVSILRFVLLSVTKVKQANDSLTLARRH